MIIVEQLWCDIHLIPSFNHELGFVTNRLHQMIKFSTHILGIHIVNPAEFCVVGFSYEQAPSVIIVIVII